MDKGTFKIESMGCRTNQYEAQAFRDQLVAMGWTAAGEGQVAELCLVNTCTVTESADSSSRHMIRKQLRENPGARVVVTGCLAERDPQQLLALGVEKVVANPQKERLLADLFEEENLPEFAIRAFEGHTRAFVKVQDGCNSFCSYCIIPYVRGRSRSRSIEQVVREVEELVANGYKEVVITGINVGDFDGADGRCTLAQLIARVDQIQGLKRIRLSSIDPDEVTEELLQTILQGRHTMHSMHIVLQSGSNRILKRMNRKYTRHQFLETVSRCEAADVDFTFTTDVIVGFPGETEENFEDTLEIIRQVGFAKVHMFPYSARPRTRAALFDQQISSEVMAERKARLLKVAEQSAWRQRERFVGRRMTILTEEGDEKCLYGHTENFFRVSIPRDHFLPNQLIAVELMQNTPREFLGKPLCVLK